MADSTNQDNPARLRLRAASEGFAAQAAARLAVLALAVVVTSRGLESGGFRYTDESRHAVSGAFLLDFLREGRWSDPVGYAEEYYVRYPALCIPYYAPPLFHCAEAVFFALLGVTASAARMSILCFHAASALVLFELTARGRPLWVAASSALLFVSFPTVVYWSRAVVLEPPATLMILLASWQALRFSDRPSPGRGLVWLSLVSAAIGVKQTAAFILPAHLAYFAWNGRIGRWTFFGIVLVTAGLAAAYFLFWAELSPYQFAAVAQGGLAEWLSPGRLWHFPGSLPAMAGWPASAALLLGLASLKRRRTPVDALFVVSALAFLAMMAGTMREALRYACVAMPFAAHFAALGVESIGRLRSSGVWKVLTGAAIIGPGVVVALQTPPDVVTGYEQAAKFVAGLPGGPSILFEGFWDGDFVFFCRQHDDRRRLVLRGSKVLYNFASYRDVDFRSYVSGPADVEKLLKSYGVRYVVVEDVDESRTRESGYLRSLLETPKFRLLARVPIEKTGRRRPLSRHLEVYEYLETPPAGRNGVIEMELPGVRRKIRIPLPSN